MSAPTCFLQPKLVYDITLDGVWRPGFEIVDQLDGVWKLMNSAGEVLLLHVHKDCSNVVGRIANAQAVLLLQVHKDCSTATVLSMSPSLINTTPASDEAQL